MESSRFFWDSGLLFLIMGLKKNPGFFWLKNHASPSQTTPLEVLDAVEKVMNFWAFRLGHGIMTGHALVNQTFLVGFLGHKPYHKPMTSMWSPCKKVGSKTLFFREYATGYLELRNLCWNIESITQVLRFQQILWVWHFFLIMLLMKFLSV